MLFIFNKVKGNIVLYDVIKNIIFFWFRVIILKIFGSEIKLMILIDRDGKDIFFEVFKNWMIFVIWYMFWSCWVWLKKIFDRLVLLWNCNIFLKEL